VGAEAVIGYLREQQISLTYGPAAATLHAGTTTVTSKQANPAPRALIPEGKAGRATGSPA